MKVYDIKAASSADALVCAQIEADNFSEPWSEKSFLDAMSDKSTLFYVVCADNRVVGYYVARNICDEINLYTIAVDDNYKGYGFGKALLLHLIEQSQSQNALFIGLEVRASNAKAIALYERNGFVRTGNRCDFYKKPTEDAYLYTLLFNEE